MPRYMFETILFLYGPAVALAYVYLTAEKHRYRRRFEDRGKFFVSLGEMQRASGLRNFYQIAQLLRNQMKYPEGNRVFEFSGYRRMCFTDWNIVTEQENVELYFRREQCIREAVRELKEKGSK